jgi:hypothetical protein
VAAFGELLLRGGVWGDRQIVPRAWVDLATSKHSETQLSEEDLFNPDALVGYGYQFWMSRHGYRGSGAFGQLCVVVPSHDLVVAVTCGGDPLQEMPGALWELLLPGLDDPASARDDEVLAERLRQLSFAKPPGSAAPSRSATARIVASAGESALPGGTTVVVEPVDGGWHLQLGSSVKLTVGHEQWWESSPLGRPVVAAGAWQGDTFIADLYVITTPHRVRLVLDANAGTAVATWSTVPLTTPDLTLHLRSPLMTRPDVA